MILTPEEKEKLLQTRGLSMKDYDIDENLQIIDKPYQAPQPIIHQPSVTPETIGPPKLTSTPVGAFFKSMGEEAPSMIGSGLGMAGGLKAWSATGMPFGPYGAAAFGLGGAFAGGGGMRRLQNFIEPESWQEAAARANEEHPIASGLGRLAAIPFGGFNPSPKNVVKAGGSLAQVIGSKLGRAPLSATGLGEAEMANLINVGAGAGISGAANVAQQTLSDQPFDILQAARALGEGALFNRPNVIGRAYGFHDPSTMLSERQQRMATNPLDYGEAVPGGAPVREPIITPYNGPPDIQAEVQARARGLTARPIGDVLQETIRAKTQPEIPIEPAVRPEPTGAVDSPEALAQIARDEKDALAAYNKRLEDFQKAQTELATERAKNEKLMVQQREVQEKMPGLEEQIKAQQIGTTEKGVEPDFTTLSGEMIHPDYTYRVEEEILRTQREAEQARTRARVPTHEEFLRMSEGEQRIAMEQAEAMRLQSEQFLKDIKARKAQEGIQSSEVAEIPTGEAIPEVAPERARTALQREVLAKKGKVPLAPTADWFESLQNLITKVKGIGHETGKPISTATGKEVPGQHIGSQDKILINPDLAGADTQPHELVHATLKAMRQSNRSFDRRMVQKFERAVEASGDYTQWRDARIKEGLPSTPEEYIATDGGYQFIKRHLNLAQETPFKSWWGDFNAYLKTRFTKHGTPEDYQRVLDNIITLDKRKLSEYSTGTISKTGIPSPISTRSSEETDLRRYDELTQEVKDRTSKGIQPETTTLQEIEDIKNKRGGIPPVVKPSDVGLSSEYTDLPPANDKRVAKLLERGAEGTEKGEIDQANAYELRKLLLKKFDWDEMPDLEVFLKSKMFDPEDSRHWEQANDIYNKYINAPKVVERKVVEPKPTERKKDVSLGMREPIIPEGEMKTSQGMKKALVEVPREGLREVPPAEPTTTPVKKVKELSNAAIEAYSTGQGLPSKPVFTPSKGEGTIFQRPSEEPRPSVESRLEPMSKKLLADEKKASKREWEEFDKIRNPVGHAATLRDRYVKVSKYLQELKDEGFKRESEQIQFIERRLRSVKMQYDMLIEKHGIREPPIESALENKYINPDIHDASESLLPHFIRPEVEKIESIDHPQARVLGEGLRDFYAQRRSNTGRLTNAFLDDVLKQLPISKRLLQGTNSPDFEAVRQRREDIMDNVANPAVLTPKQQEIDDAVTAAIDRANNLRTFGNAPPLNNQHLPVVPSRRVLNAFLNDPAGNRAQQLIADWNDYYLNTLHESQRTADRNLDILKRGYARRAPDIAKYYTHADAVQTIQLPPSWREKNLIDTITRFNNRMGRRIAYHEAIQNNPDVQDALNNRQTGLAANDTVKGVLEDVAGVHESQNEAALTAASGIIRAAMLGPLTGAKDFVANFTLGMQHQTLGQSIVSPFKAITNIRENIADSFKAGVNRHNISAIEMGDDQYGDFTNLARRTRDVISNVQGRNYLERVTRGIAYGQGKFLAMDNLWAAHNGNATSQQLKFLNDFAPKNWRTTHMPSGQFSGEALMETAAKYVESVQGTYDVRGLPAFAQKGSLSPVLSLARWNIEKLNNFDKYVLQPARQGNIKPLLMSTIGAIVGGEAVNQLVELATGRKEKTPKYKELQAIAEEPEGKLAPALLYKAAGLSSLSGYAGIAGDLTKMALDKLYFKNVPQTYNNPLLTGANTIVDNLNDAVEAWRAGDLNGGFDVFSQAMEDLLQTYRLGLAHLSPEKKKDIERVNKLRDYKLFKTTTGLPVAPASAERVNPFLDKEMREFKRTGDVAHAAQMLPGLIQRAFEKSKGNMDVLRSELRKLKANSYQTMPSPETIPQSFMRYMNRLSVTQGPEEASKRLSDYMIQREKNKIKSELVPTL